VGWGLHASSGYIVATQEVWATDRIVVIQDRGLQRCISCGGVRLNSRDSVVSFDFTCESSSWPSVCDGKLPRGSCQAVSIFTSVSV
jgi:hypothetical protein